MFIGKSIGKHEYGIKHIGFHVNFLENTAKFLWKASLWISPPHSQLIPTLIKCLKRSTDSKHTEGLF